MKSVFKIVLLMSFINTLSGCAFPLSSAQKWEYKRVVLDPFDGKNIFQIAEEGVTAETLLAEYHAKINAFGHSGWELISVSPDTKTLFFKRRL
jgi:hypothetical protein